MARTRDRLAKAAAKGADKAALGGREGRTGRITRRALDAREVADRRYPGYGPLVLAGLLVLGGAAAVAIVLLRRGRRGDPGPEDAVPPAPPPASTPAGPERPGDPAGPRVEDRDRVPPEGARPAPSLGEGPGVSARGSGASPGAEIEERVRARIGEDPRTKDLPPVSVEVDDGMAWIDGDAPSQEGKEALTEVVGSVEGVNIVVNRVVVGRP